MHPKKNVGLLAGKYPLAGMISIFLARAIKPGTSQTGPESAELRELILAVPTTTGLVTCLGSAERHRRTKLAAPHLRRSGGRLSSYLLPLVKRLVAFFATFWEAMDSSSWSLDGRGRSDHVG